MRDGTRRGAGRQAGPGGARPPDRHRDFDAWLRSMAPAPLRTAGGRDRVWRLLQRPLGRRRSVPARAVAAVAAALGTAAGWLTGRRIGRRTRPAPRSRDAHPQADRAAAPPASAPDWHAGQ